MTKRQRKLNSPISELNSPLQVWEFDVHLTLDQEISKNPIYSILVACSWTIDTKYYTADVCIWTICIDDLDCGNHLRSAWDLCEALVMVFDLSDVRTPFSRIVVISDLPNAAVMFFSGRSQLLS